MSKQTFKIISI